MNQHSPPSDGSSAVAMPAASSGIDDQVVQKLNQALKAAERDYAAGTPPAFALSDRMRAALEELSEKSEKASTGFTNIVTSVAIKAARSDIDVRYHQVQIQSQTPHPAGFNFRGVSEKAIYPWMSKREFRGAKSGWQTRTFERPKPYMLDYDENIGDIKESFLVVYDELSVHDADADEALRFLLFKQVEYRANKQIKIAEPKTTDISLIAGMLEQHFSRPYQTKGASRLPVLALHAIYAVLVRELGRFEGKTLKPLQPHSAADSQTGALGDVEVANADGSIFEALEIKHGIAVNEKILEDVKRKLMDQDVDRYYVLTTHDGSGNQALAESLKSIQARLGCQVIVDGVVPSLRYSLRLLRDPASFFPEYASLLKGDKAISFEHREAWNRIAVG